MVKSRGLSHTTNFLKLEVAVLKAHKVHNLEILLPLTLNVPLRSREHRKLAIQVEGGCRRARMSLEANKAEVDVTRSWYDKLSDEVQLLSL